MNIKYDKIADAKYIRIKKGKVAKTQKKKPWFLLDLNKDGEIIGVEVLNASKHLVSISTFGGEVVSYGIGELQRIGGESQDQSVQFDVREDLVPV